MAISRNPLLKDIRGHIDKIVVVKQYEHKTVITAYPDMTGIIPSEAQKQQRIKLKKAQAIAAEMLKDPVVKAQYKLRCSGRQRPYDLLRSELMKGIVPGL